MARTPHIVGDPGRPSFYGFLWLRVLGTETLREIPVCPPFRPQDARWFIGASLTCCPHLTLTKVPGFRFRILSTKLNLRKALPPSPRDPRDKRHDLRDTRAGDESLCPSREAPDSPRTPARVAR